MKVNKIKILKFFANRVTKKYNFNQIFVFFLTGTTPAPPPPPPPVIVFSPPPGVAPSNVPQPGQPGGGDPPSSNPLAAALAPVGTVPVAVFPRYTRARTYPAICVIFSELDYSEKHNNNYGRKKRGLLNFPWRRYNDLRRRKDSYGSYVVTVPRKFGFRCKIRLVEERCQLGMTCDQFGNKISPASNPGFGNQNVGPYQPVDNFLRRQTGEQFSSDARPDCRVTLAPDGCT